MILEHSHHMYGHGFELEQAVDTLERILADPEQKARLKALTPHEIAMLGDFWTYGDTSRLRQDMCATPEELQHINAFAPPHAGGLAINDKQYAVRAGVIGVAKCIAASEQPDPTIIQEFQRDFPPDISGRSG